MGEAELDGVCYRFASDLSLVCFERKVRCLADFLHECCVVHGVADIEIANHTLIAKYYATDSFKSNICLPPISSDHHCRQFIMFRCVFGYFAHLAGELRRGPSACSIQVQYLTWAQWSLQRVHAQHVGGL